MQFDLSLFFLISGLAAARHNVVRVGLVRFLTVKGFSCVLLVSYIFVWVRVEGLLAKKKNVKNRRRTCELS